MHSCSMHTIRESLAQRRGLCFQPVHIQAQVICSILTTSTRTNVRRVFERFLTRLSRSICTLPPGIAQSMLMPRLIHAVMDDDDLSSTSFPQRTIVPVCFHHSSPSVPLSRQSHMHRRQRQDFAPLLMPQFLSHRSCSEVVSIYLTFSL